MADTNVVRGKYAMTPGGWRDKSRIKTVRSGSVIRSLETPKKRAILTDHFQPHYPKDIFLLPPVGSLKRMRIIRAVQPDGWGTYAGWTNNLGAPIERFISEWQVPPPPIRRDDQTIFLFNGLQNRDYILQPVLQWGRSHAGGGAYWTISNWYVDGNSNPTYHTPLVQVPPGTMLRGIMEIVGANGPGVFTYRSRFEGYPGSDLVVRNVPELFWANAVLETYHIGSCNHYPGIPSTQFRLNRVFNHNGSVSPAWTMYSPLSGCGQHIRIQENGTTSSLIEIFYR